MRRSPATGERSERSERVVGVNAAYAAMRMRARDVLYIAYAESARRELRELLREAARLRIAYREVHFDELERIADTVHHEGVCLMVRPRPALSIGELARAVAQEGVILALDRVQNPHNIGALLRSLAFFRGGGLLLESERERVVGTAALRIAEGGAEYVPTSVVENLEEGLRVLADRGLPIVGADAHRGTAIAKFAFPRRCVIVLGSERYGITDEVAALCSDFVHIPGSGDVESLNVAVAAGIVLAYATGGGARS